MRRKKRRSEILESDEWDAMRRDFQEWLAVQQIYTVDEITQIVNELNDQALRLSEDELRDLLSDMQDRLEVLMSPEAAEARQWVARFLAVAQNPEQRLREIRPDVMSMSAGEIRQELQKFQTQQVARQQSQAAFERVRELQAQAALGVHESRRQTQQQVRDNRSLAARNAQVRSPYAPLHRDLPNFTDFDRVDRRLDRSPFHTVSPWGTPVRWHPLYGYWW